MRLTVMLMLALTMWPGKATAQAPDTASDAIVSAVQSYHAGHVRSAIADAEAVYDSNRASLNSNEQFYLLSNILDLCAGAYDLDCMLRRLEDLIAVRPLVPSYGSFVDPELDAQVGRHVGDAAKITFDPEWMTMWLMQWFEAQPETPFSPILYTQRQLLAARFYQALDRPKEAERARFKALSMLISMKNPGLHSWNLGVAITEVLLQTVETDPTFASTLYIAAGDFAARSLPDTGPEKTIFRVVESELLMHQGNIGGAIGSTRAAIDMLNRSEIADHMRMFMLQGMHNQLIVACLLAEDVACVEGAIAEHPFTERFDAGRSPSVSSDQEFQYVVARVIAELGLNRTPDARLRRALNVPLDFLEEGEYRSANDLYRRAAITAWKNVEKSYPEPSEAIEFAAAIVEHANRAFGKSPTTFPMLGMIDKVIVAIATSGLTTSGASGDRAVELQFQLAELFNRDIRQADAESMKLIARGSNDEQRRDLQTWQRLNGRMRHEYVLAMRRLVDRAQGQIDGRIEYEDPEFGPSGRANFRDYSVRTVFRDYDQLLRGYAERADLQNSLQGANDVPTLADLQDALNDNEAFATIQAAGGYVLSICITRTATHSVRGAVDPQQSLLDYKLIQAALTSGHAPNDELDSQFPVDAAHRYYNLLIRPIEPCLDGKDHLIWAPINQIAALPLSALLRNVPEKTEIGYRLDSADWFINDVGISNVLSARAFLAARAVSAARVDASGFLGIGDPVLGPETVSSSSSVLRGSVPASEGGLYALSALPETADELRDIADTFGEGTTQLLLAEEATEGSFRSQPVGEYEYIAFATHGLIREEIPGLTEAALVLTPNRPEDTKDDGLLQASEIADLSLNARLVALSACNTANYEFQYFDSEMSGLAAAFTSAGVPGTLATLWPVDSRTSREVVAATFDNLQSGQTQAPATALADAQRHFLQSPPSIAYAHPRFWAPFVLYGDGGMHIDAAVSDAMTSRTINLSSVGGEIEVMASTDEGLFARGLGDLRDERFESVVLRIDGDIIWETRDRALGSGRGMGVLPGALVVDGFVGGGEKQRGVATVVWYDKEDGQELRRRSFPAQDTSSFGIGLTVTDSNEIIVATQEGALGESEGDFVLTRLSAIGDTLHTRRFPLPFVGLSSAATLNALGDRLLLSFYETQTDFRMDESRYVLDDFDEFVTCVLSARSYLYVLDADTFELIRRIDTSPFGLHDIVQVGDAIWAAATRYSPCDVKETFKLLDITSIVNGDENAQFEEIYSELPGEQSSARNIFFDGHRIVVVGNTQRVTGVVRRSPNFYLEDYLKTEVQFAPYIVREGLILQLSPDGELLRRDRLVAGSDVLPATSGIVGDTLVVGGIIAGRSAISKIDLNK